MYRMIPLLLAAALLAGCGSMSPSQIVDADTPQLLETAKNQALTARWTLLSMRSSPQPEIIAELVRRGEITKREAESITRGDIFVGMTADAVTLVLGPPHRITHVSARTSDAASYHYSAPGIGAAEVRLRGGKVVSWAMPN